MKIVLNCCYGGFDIPKKWIELCGLGPDFEPSFVFCRDGEKVRTNPKLVELVEQCISSGTDPFEGEVTMLGLRRLTELGIAEIPDDVTDWTIDEYDGIESVIFVHDGKLGVAYGRSTAE